MRRAVLFDFGGVILSSPFEAFERFELAQGLPVGFLRQVNSTDPDDNAWARLERGEVDLAGFDAAFAEESERLGHRVQGSAVLPLLGGEVRPVMVTALERIRAAGGFVTGLLTNNFVAANGPDASPPQAWAPVLGLFDAIVESSRVGVRKPERRFYELACAELGIEPTEAVFLDDLGVNLKPARAMGMVTIKVDDPDTALAELAEVIGLDLAGPSRRSGVAQ